MVERTGGGGKFKMETIVWWNAVGKIETKKENGDHCMVERRGGKFK